MKTAELRQYRVAGGVAAWQIPIVAAILSLGALGLGSFEPVLLVVLLGFIAQVVRLATVVEVSPVGLTRGFVLSGRFVGRTTVMAWETIANVHTEWRYPGDDTALVTVVRDREDRSIQLSTAMGLRNYLRCLAAITENSPFATRSGLTDAVLGEQTSGNRAFFSAAATAGALALVMIALVGVHYLWAQGRSSVARQLEQAERAAPSARP